MRQVFMFMCLLVGCTLLAQNKIDRARYMSLLQQKKYSQVFNEAMQQRNEVYGKCAVIDYFIAKSLCLDGHRQKSVEWLQYIRKNYALKPNAKKFIGDELRSCSGTSNSADLSVVASYTVPLPQAGVGGMMKGGMTHECFNTSGIINFENLVLEDDLEARLFKKQQAATAVANLKRLLGNDYAVASNSRYVIVSQKSMHISAADVLTVTGRLDQAYDFFTSYFSLRPPDKLITVYLSPDVNSLAKTAKLVHGIRIPSTLLGYSLLADLSLSGISDPDRVGTLYHELFHLLVRTDIGDVPAWVDEGLASLYSTSYWKNDKLIGGDTWRLRQLQPPYLNKTNVSIPSLAALTDYSWDDFNGGENNNLCVASVNYALSNFFMLYLQEKNLLQPLINFYRARKGPQMDGDNQESFDHSVVEKLFDKSLSKVQKDFDAWFKSKYNTGINSGNNNNTNNNFNEAEQRQVPNNPFKKGN